MMAYPLLAAMHAASVSRTYLSTDAASMARVAAYYGAEVLARAAEVTGPDVDLEHVVADAYRQIQDAAGGGLEALVILLCNAPTVTSDMIENALDLLASNPDSAA